MDQKIEILNTIIEQKEKKITVGQLWERTRQRMTLHFGRATPEFSMDPFPEKTTRAEREFAMSHKHS